jgi:Anti-sigma-D factor RsdA to sigma factor binding region
VDDQEDMPDRPDGFALDGPLPLGVTEPVDVAQVRVDDALIEALSSSDELQIDDPIDERLAGLLRLWRQDVHAEPERPLDLTSATAALAATPPASHWRRQNPFGPLATAAALLVIAFIGLGLAARGAEPGDPLWGVTKVLYSDRAKSVEARVTVAAKLDQAKQALQSGNTEAAMIALREAQQKLPGVAVEDGKQELSTVADQLIAQALNTQSTEPPTISTSPTVPTSAMPTATPTSEQPVPVTTINPLPPTTIAVPDPTTTTVLPAPTTSLPPVQATGTATTEVGSPQGGDPPKGGDVPPSGSGDTSPSGGTDPSSSPQARGV